jgi:hypothetical protein
VIWKACLEVPLREVALRDVVEQVVRRVTATQNHGSAHVWKANAKAATGAVSKMAGMT